MSQHGVAVRLVSLYNFKSIQKRFSVFVCLQFIRQIIIVQTFVPIIPEFNCIGSFPCCIATLTNCGDTLRIAAASVGNIRPISILFPPVGGSLGLFIPSTCFPALSTVLMLFTLKIIENLLTIHALFSRCDRCHVSHGITARCLSACHRQSVGCHPDTDGATAAPFRL